MRTATRARFVLAMAIALVLLAPGTSLATGTVTSTHPQERPAAGTDEAELWYAMERIEHELQQSPLLVRDPALNAYVRSVLCKVTGEYCRDLRVYLVDVPWFNASMAPNGAMIVWTGSLLRIRNEAQLALVLGHEFGHYRERHTLQQWRKLKRSSAFVGTFGALATGAGAGVASMAANLAGMATMMKFSRDKEREADRIGFAQLLAQGYDPNAGVALWDGMLREEEARDSGEPIPVFSTHPQTRERRDDLKAAADAIASPPRELGADRYRAATRPFLRHWLDGELTRRMYASSIRVIEDLQLTAPPEDAGLYTFALGEAWRHRGKDPDRVQAAKLYALAVTEPGAPAEAWREHGMALRAAGDKAAAASAFHRYLQLAPQAEDMAFVSGYLAELETPR
ncbi:MAG: M48 family metalloprotease [Arenimonas sp.]